MTSRPFSWLGCHSADDHPDYIEDPIEIIRIEDQNRIISITDDQSPTVSIMITGIKIIDDLIEDLLFKINDHDRNQGARC